MGEPVLKIRRVQRAALLAQVNSVGFVQLPVDKQNRLASTNSESNKVSPIKIGTKQVATLEAPISNFQRTVQIRKVQLDAFKKESLTKFAEELTPALAEKYPHILPSFPKGIQKMIVVNMLGRACHWGITWQSALVIFSELMLAIAPNFDQEPRIKAALKSPRMDPNGFMLEINRRVPNGVWNSATAASQNLPLFTAPEFIDAPIDTRILQAIPMVLGDRLKGIDLPGLAADSILLAKELSLQKIEESGLVLAAWRLMYGPDFQKPETHPWLRDIFNHQNEPLKKVAMLKYRICLDHQRFV